MAAANTMIRLMDLHARRNVSHAETVSLTLFVTRPPMQRKPCWDIYDKTDMVDTMARGWGCNPIYIIQRPECIEICSEGEDHVFDGAHKAEAGCEFIEGKFPITYRKTELQFGILKEYTGKYFKELPRELQLKIKNYTFSVNIIDEETANDPDALSILWKRISRAGKPLNSYEISIPVLASLIHEVLAPVETHFHGTIIFPEETSKRGAMERLLQSLLAFAEMSSTLQVISINRVINDWQAQRLGTSMKQRTESVALHGEMWREILLRISKMLADLTDLNTFHDDKGSLLPEKALLKTELPFVLSRLAVHFPKIEDFRSQKRKLSERLKREIFSLTPAELLTKFEGTGRNGSYQTKILRFIESIIVPVKEAVQPRAFTVKQKKEKLEMQGGLCTWCSKPILPHQQKDGDHMVEWSQGGATTPDNLEVMHYHCHQEKTASMTNV